MNKYEKYLDMVEFLNVIFSGSTHKMEEYNRKKEINNKIYFYTKFRDILVAIINDKLKMGTKNTARQYSDSDVEFLKQFSAMDLTIKEAYLVGKKEEYWECIRSISSKINDETLAQKIDNEINKLNEDYTPRILYQFYMKHNKRSNTMK